MRLGDLRLREFTHPDSINVTAWDVEQFTLATGMFAEEGQAYWRRITPGLDPFTDKNEAVMLMNSKENNDVL